MTTIIIDAPRFDITVTATMDHRGELCYLVRYGLDAEKRYGLREALACFQDCVEHALAHDGA